MKRISVADIIPGEFNLTGLIKQAELGQDPKTQRERERELLQAFTRFLTH